MLVDSVGGAVNKGGPPRTERIPSIGMWCGDLNVGIC